MILPVEVVYVPYFGNVELLIILFRNFGATEPPLEYGNGVNMCQIFIFRRESVTFYYSSKCIKGREYTRQQFWFAVICCLVIVRTGHICIEVDSGLKIYPPDNYHDYQTT